MFKMSTSGSNISKDTSVLAIGQLRHQSATAPGLATHAVDGYLLKFT